MSRVRGGPGGAGTARRPKVLVIGPTPPPYHGGSVATEYVLNSSLRDGFELIHLDTSDRRGLENAGRFDLTNVALAFVHGARFVRLLLARRPDVVYIPVAQNRLGFWRDFLFFLPSRLLGKRIVVHVHGGHFGEFYARTDPLTRWLVRWSLRGVRRAIVLGERLRPILDGLVPPDRIAVVPNGVADEHGGVPPEAIGAGRSGRRVVYLGTLTRTKGFGVVLEAAGRLLEELPDVEYVLAGELHDGEARSIAAPYRTERYRDRITFPGVVAGREKAELLRGADVFVFPSFYPYEGHPYVILEAMAAGLPVVTTAHGAIPEMVTDGKNGYLVPQRDPDALAGRIRELLEDDGLRTRMAAASRRRYLESFTVERWAERMAAVFRAAVDAR